MKPTKTEKTKSTAKAMGLKSTLIYDDTIAVTSFAQNKQTDARDNIEKITDRKGTEKGGEERMFHTEIDSASIKIDGKILEKGKTLPRSVSFDNPSELRNDYVGIKSALEKNVFRSRVPGRQRPRTDRV